MVCFQPHEPCGTQHACRGETGKTFDLKPVCHLCRPLQLNGNEYTVYLKLCGPSVNVDFQVAHATSWEVLAACWLQWCHNLNPEAFGWEAKHLAQSRGEKGGRKRRGAQVGQQPTLPCRKTC